MQNYYREQVVNMPKDSVLSGWDFGLNPWQNYRTTQGVLIDSAGASVQTGYSADQTILHQQAGVDRVLIERGSAAENYAYKVSANQPTNQFAIIQYISPQTARDLWGRRLSVMVKGSSTRTGGLPIKARLIYRSSLPPTVSASEPIASWGSGDNPNFTN